MFEVLSNGCTVTILYNYSTFRVAVLGTTLKPFFELNCVHKIFSSDLIKRRFIFSQLRSVDGSSCQIPNTTFKCYNASLYDFITQVQLEFSEGCNKTFCYACVIECDIRKMYNVTCFQFKKHSKSYLLIYSDFCT